MKNRVIVFEKVEGVLCKFRIGFYEISNNQIKMGKGKYDA